MARLPKDLEDLFAAYNLLDDPNSKYVFAQNRRLSFKNFVYDRSGDACTSEKLANAGFYYTGVDDEDPSATCAFCMKQMVFDPEDDPWTEHVSHCPTCMFVQIGKREEEQKLSDFLKLLCFRKVSLDVASLDPLENHLQGCIEELRKMFEKART